MQKATIDTVQYKPLLQPIYVLNLKIKATPFIKWVGGKRSILDELKKYLPDKYNSYYEPFVGGGALFFDIHEKANVNIISDSNLSLIVTYTAIKKSPEKVVEELKKHERNHGGGILL